MHRYAKITVYIRFQYAASKIYPSRQCSAKNSRKNKAGTRHIQIPALYSPQR